MPKIVKQFRFCPRCGGKLRILRAERFDICSRCGFELYDSAITTVTVIIVDARGQILITKRANAPRRGWWGTPGGFVERGESPEDAARREVREELGLKLSKMKVFGTYFLDYNYQQVNIACAETTFFARVSTGKKLKARDDISEARFFKPENIPFTRLAFPSHRKAIRAYLTERRRLRR